MKLSRRSFTRGAAGVALATQFSGGLFAKADWRIAAALAAIRAFGEADLALNHIAGTTLGVVAMRSRSVTPGAPTAPAR